ncbi:MAG: hypothetical protein QOJ54_75, partial [Aliidongia sp.]|nr:hypothetical protein [Aliidongia sp.]
PHHREDNSGPSAHYRQDRQTQQRVVDEQNMTAPSQSRNDNLRTKPQSHDAQQGLDENQL